MPNTLLRPSMRRPDYHDRAPGFGPVPIWRLSCSLYAAGHFRLARVLKGINFFGFRALLPPEVVLGEDVRLEHYGLNVMVHPNTVIGARCRIYNGATLGSTARIGSADLIIVGEDVLIGAGAKIVNRAGRTLTIGDRVRIGANAVVVSDVPADTVVRAPLATFSFHGEQS